MTSPFLQPSWTIEEAVLLVEASENIASKTSDIETEARRLSERLRKAVGLRGLTVSARYRNEDDVRNNLKSMSSMLKMIDYVDEEYLLGSTLGSVALYYCKHPERYAQLLDKANLSYPIIEKTVQNDSCLTAEFDVYKKTDSSQPLEVVKEEESRIVDIEELVENIVVDESYERDNEITDSIQESDAESAQIDTVSEGVSTYHTIRRKRPRISNGNTGNGMNGTGFSSVFPYSSSQYLSTHSTGRQKSKTETVWFSSEETKHLGEITVEKIIDKDKNKEFEKDTYQAEESRNNTVNSKLDNVREILISKFRRGYRIGSALDRKRFRDYYKSRFDKSVGASEEVVEGYIRKLGFEYNGKIYIADIVLTDDVRDRICAFIIDVLTTERDYVYFEHIYELFRDEIESTITDMQMLRLYLQELRRKDWIFRDSYIASSFDVRVSVKDELLRYMLEASGVMDLDRVEHDLQFLPKEEVIAEWNRNNDTLISNGPNERFHIGSFYCPEDTLNSVASLIQSGLKNASFMASEDLMEDIQLNLPELVSNNHHISALGIRNGLARLLSDKFSFRNNVISTTSNSYDGPAAIMAFCNERGYFTFEEIEDVSRKIRCSPNFYLDKIYEKSVRIDDEHFIPRTQITFDVKEIDKALDLFIKDLYTVVGDILTYDAFPSCGEFSWNKWILENYLLTSSKKYCLIRPKCLSKESVTGAIVRRDGMIKTYDDLIIQAIAHSEIPIEEEAANEYLYDKGIINVKRKNGQVKKALLKAREYRNRINKNKN